MVDYLIMANWGFPTSARVLLCIAHDPGARLRDIAGEPGHHRAQRLRHRRRPRRARYVIKQKDDRRNRYQIQAHLPLPEAGGGNLDCSSDLRCQARRGDLAVRRTPHGTGEGCWSAVRVNSG